MKRFWKKYFDFNNNKKIDWWEILLPIIAMGIVEIILNIIASYIYDKIK